jgi:hypothetical protein
MRAWWLGWLVALGVSSCTADDPKLTTPERIEILRGIMAEYATVKVPLPRSKKPLQMEATGKYERVEWDIAGKQFGPAARVGDLVQVTKVEIEKDSITLQINGGFRSGKKWYEHIEVGMGNSGGPLGNRSGTPGGTSIAVLFHKPLPAMKASEFKKMLAPVLDFEKRSATEQYVENLPAPVQKAIKEKRAIDGMDREQVVLAMGRPNHKSREVKDGVELEDWIYGDAPGKITFVTFQGSKVVKIKEAYAGLGGETVKPPPPPL